VTAGIWEEKSAAIHYADYSFIMTRHQLKQETPVAGDVSASDVTSATAAADTKPTVQTADEDDSCKPFCVCLCTCVFEHARQRCGKINCPHPHAYFLLPIPVGFSILIISSPSPNFTHPRLHPRNPHGHHTILVK